LSRRSAEHPAEHAVYAPWAPTRLVRMSAISRDDVAHLAMLARIDLSDAELDKMSGELAIILQSVARVSEVATDDVPPTSHPLPLTNVTRPDVVRPSLPAAEVLAAAPASEQQRFSVPRILDED
jgi:aspartyl-tRNA(Asn)/glutamyl-tRNA(Gln) amidotransferase subunit C